MQGRALFIAFIFMAHLLAVIILFGPGNIAGELKQTKVSNSDLGQADYVAKHELNCTDNFLPNGWCMEKESKTPRYFFTINANQPVPPQQVVRHYTHKGYEKCLAGKTIVLIGDSRVRYQFLNLAHFLISQSSFMKCRDHPTRNHTTHDPACTVIEKKHGQYWNIWYKKSTDMLATTDQSLHGNRTQLHLCDCFRSRINPALTVENRFIKRTTQFGEINLVYLSSMLDKVDMNFDFPPFSSFLPPPRGSINRCLVGECSHENRKNIFTGNVNETLWSILPVLKATHAFVSYGWERSNESQAQSNFSCILNEFERQHPSIKTFLLSTPPRRHERSNLTEMFDVSKLKCSCGVLDRSIVNKDVPYDWYFDDVHVLGILNEEYNHLMVESICPIVGKTYGNH